MSTDDGNIKIFARLRKIMPWEDNVLSATAADSHRILNRTSKRQTAYDFTKVFTPSDDNHKCFEDIAQPMLREVERGYDAMLMAYGQTGSGKTYSVLGKMKKSVKGLLTLSLEHLLSAEAVSSVELSAVETFGHHIQKIRLFDLGDSANQIEQWDHRVAMRPSAKIRSAHRIRLRRGNIEDTIKRLHSASHFAPTAKNPQSSRGHICWITTVHLRVDSAGAAAVGPQSQMVAHWIVLDLAGSEGESALTPQFQRTADASEVMARRLEAWCINHGLSELQMMFNELLGIKKKALSTGSGLKKTLSEFVSQRSLIAVLFTISPSQDNSKSTEATLRFAESAALVRCTPVKAERTVNKDALIAELRKFIEGQQAMIEDKNARIHALESRWMESYLADSATNTPVVAGTNGKVVRDSVAITHRESTHSLDFEAAMEPLTFELPAGGPELGGDRSGTLELPAILVKQLSAHQMELDEQRKATSLWNATASQFLSHEDEFEMEQSLKKEMSDVRRASRVSADVHFAAQMLTLHDAAAAATAAAAGDGEATTGGMMTPSIRSLSVMTPLDEESEDDDESELRQCTKRRLLKILSDHRSGYQLAPQSLRGLNRKELSYLCTVFAAEGRGHGAPPPRDRDTDRIIQCHEEQIQFLSEELDRMQRAHRHSSLHSVSSFDQFGGRRLVLMDDIDEKFEPSMTDDAAAAAPDDRLRRARALGGYGPIAEREPSPSSTRIDPPGHSIAAPLKLYDSGEDGDGDEADALRPRSGKDAAAEAAVPRQCCFCAVM